MNHSIEKWELLTTEWAESLKKAKVRQAIIDDKMHSFLRGNGCLPAEEELKLVEQLWEQHVQARNKMNHFIQSVQESYIPTD